MSRPFNNSVLTVPPALAGSRVIGPLISLAALSGRSCQRVISQSGWGKLSDSILEPLGRLAKPVAQIPGLLRLLGLLHILATAFVLLVSTFASTDQIALVVVAAFAIGLLRAWLAGEQFRPTLIDLLVGGFFLTALVATFFSSYVSSSIVGMAKFSVFLAGYLTFRALFARSSAALPGLLGLLALLGAFEAAVGFYQYINHVQPLATWQDPSVNPEDQLTRIFGTLQPYNPNLLAGFLIPAMSAGLGLSLIRVAQGKFITAPIWGLLGLMSFAALVLTGSRGGYLAIIAMAVTAFFYLGHLLWHEPALARHMRLKAAWLLTGLFSVSSAILGIFLMPAIRNRFLSIFAMRQDSSNSYRINVWMSTWELIKDNWLVGIGPGNNTFKQVYGLYMVPGYNALSAYSIFLEMWAEQGIIGLLLFLLLLMVLVLRGVMVAYGNLPLARKLLVGTLLVGVVGSVVYGLFDTIWYRPSVNLLFWMLVAGLSVETEPDTEPAAATP